MVSRCNLQAVVEVVEALSRGVEALPKAVEALSVVEALKEFHTMVYGLCGVRFI